MQDCPQAPLGPEPEEPIYDEQLENELANQKDAEREDDRLFEELGYE